MIRNILAFICLLLFIYLAFSSESATAVNKSDKSRFSAEATLPYLRNIANAPHPIGSTENQKVRDYIVATLRDLGLEVSVEKGYVNSSWKPTYMRMAYVENIIATLKGSDPNAKKVVLAGHYDSVFEGPGAADDGYAVASMIETVKMLKDSPRKNTIELLITDGEEMGLLGADYYAENNDLSKIGVLLNFEARGNEGPGMAFEFSDNNAWLVNEMNKASKRPIASSLSYEVYKRMPNGTDFTIFSNAGVQGINYAFIDGFSYYHNPVDNIENLSLESVQHTGENMYRMARHFANFDFTSPPEGNASFFNFYGKLIHYPAHLDLYILIFAFCLLIFTIYRTLPRKEVNFKAIGVSFVGLLGILILGAGVNFGLAFMIKKMYPQYSTFYIHQYYNHEWYFLAGLGLTVLLCWWVGSFLIKKYNYKNIGLSTSMILLGLAVVIYLFAPTGTYLMIFPMIALTTGLLLSEMFKLDEGQWKFWLLGLGMCFVLIGFWTNISHNLFLGFSFGALPGAVLPTALFCFAASGLLPGLWKKNQLLIPTFGLSLFLFSMISGHLKSKPTESAPLNSNLFFVADRHSAKSYWATENHFINEGHFKLLDNAEKGRLPRHLPFSRWFTPSTLNADKFASQFKLDSLPEQNSTRLQVHNPKRATKAYLVFDEIENIDKVMIDGQLNNDFEESATGYYYTILFGIGLDSMAVEVVKKDFSKPVDAYINMSYQEPFQQEKLPFGIVRSDGFTYISEKVQF